MELLSDPKWLEHGIGAMILIAAAVGLRHAFSFLLEFTKIMRGKEVEVTGHIQKRAGDIEIILKHAGGLTKLAGEVEDMSKMVQEMYKTSLKDEQHLKILERLSTIEKRVGDNIAHTIEVQSAVMHLSERYEDWLQSLRTSRSRGRS